MVPIDKVKDIISKHDDLEKDLSSGNIDPKLFAKKSKEYSRLGRIISTARQYVNFENEKKELETYLISAMDRKRLTSIKDVTYDKDTGVIKTIPSLTFNPTTNANGSDSLKVQVSDGLLTAEATISITINAINDRPTINNGSF